MTLDDVIIPSFQQLKEMTEETLIEQCNLCLKARSKNLIKGLFVEVYLNEIIRRREEAQSLKMLSLTEQMTSSTNTMLLITKYSLTISAIALIVAIFSMLAR
jgi:hypothetical protein